MQIQGYLFFDGRCEDAVEYYRRTLGAEVTMLMRYREAPEPLPPDMVPPGWEDKIMHASLRIGETELMMADDCTQRQSGFAGFSLSLGVDDEAEAERLFAVLSQDGQVHMPMGPTFFATRFGMLSDRFGVPWMLVGPMVERQ